MSLSVENSQNEVLKEIIGPPRYEGNSLRFEGVNIQLDKGQWSFGEGVNTHIIDTYSIWNPQHYEQIAERLKNGERAASYIMGNYGVVEVRRPHKENEFDAMFDKIKKRHRSQNFVAFVNPDDIQKLIDFDRLPKELRDLRWAEERHNIYPGPLHAVFPIKENAEVDKGVIRQEENTLAAFWIPEHWGYEKLGDKIRKKVKLGLLGGGSLNVHGKEPSYSTRELYSAFLQNPEWQEEIDMVIFDEIAESYKIGRSQTMLSFAEYPPKVLRIGSLSANAIEMSTGLPIYFEEEKMVSDSKFTASSKTKYSKKNNDIVDQKVSNALSKMGRYRDYYKNNLGRENQVNVPLQKNMLNLIIHRVHR